MINVVVLSHERLNLLKQCIESLYANTPIDQFTLVVCDDETSDFRVKRYLRSIVRKNFSLLEVQGSGHVISQLKNTAVYYSEQRFGRGDFLHIGDSDTCFLKGWSDAMMCMAACTESHGFRLWGGQIHPFHKPIITPWIIHKDCPVEWTEHSVLDGPSWLMRWDTWDKYGPFQRTTAPGPCQSEEYPFCKKLTSAEFGEPNDYDSGVDIEPGKRIGVTYPHCVIHTGLSQTDGRPAPGAAERRLLIPKGVLAE